MNYKARAGSDFLLRWKSPTAVASLPVPVLTLHHPTLGAITPTFTAVASAATISAVANDRRTLTLSGAPAPRQGLQGDEAGHAFIVSHTLGVVPVKVRAFTSSDTVILAEPLGMAYSEMSGESIQWATYEATLDGGTELASALTRPMRWTVEWSAYYGTGIDARPQRQEGLLYCVRQPFATGLHDELLFDLIPELATQKAGRQQSFAPMLARAEQVLVTWLRRDLREAGVTEDAYPSSEPRSPHRAARGVEASPRRRHGSDESDARAVAQAGIGVERERTGLQAVRGSGGCEPVDAGLVEVEVVVRG